jgi:AbrB family looped-hinge helix DNA binding protein
LEFSVTRLSSNGQVVIPRDMREKLGLEEAAGLLIFRIGDGILLKSTSENLAMELAPNLEAISGKSTYAILDTTTRKARLLTFWQA